MNETGTSTAFETAHVRVCELIRRFQRYARDNYLQPGYQEAEARKDFIDPLLKALGWDVDHEHEHNPYEQEVKVERGVSVARAQKRADYAFYLKPNYRDVRFFVEAKKPSVDLDRSSDAHFQTLRYGYSANTPLAVLTDFEQVRVLDCRLRPHPDTALDQVYKSWNYTDFLDPARFAEFYWLFSREAHADGSYQRRIDELPKPKGGAKQRGLFKGGFQPVDTSFLSELEEYRVALAKAFKKADQALGSEALTEMVQRTLDRLVFLRFLEDKQIETEIRVSDFGKGRGAWADFQSASRRLDGIYNGIVFKRATPLDDAGFAVDDAIFADICERLSAENSPYNFDAIPIHILGSIYERFLGSVIRATDKRATVEEKPEVRKAGGVYYTPEYIVRYIVQQTVGRLIAGKSPAEIAKLHFADIACGSGSFLLGIFDELLRYHAEWYNQPDQEKQAKKDGCVKNEDGLWQLSLAQRRQILLNNIYGIDIDRQAVEVAQLSLFLKLLEDERATSARQYQLEYARDARLKKLLPDLSANIVCGNSLIGWDIAGLAALGPEDEQKLNPLDFEQAFPAVMRAGGFDAIVGNPPYVLLQDEFRDPLSYDYLKRHYVVASFKVDTYHLFFERAGRLLKADGRLGFITPSNYLTNNHLEKLRRFLLSEVRLDRIIVYDGKVFAGASVDTATTICANAQSGYEEFTMVRVKPEEAPPDGDVAHHVSRSECLARKGLLISPPGVVGTAGVFTAIEKNTKPLGDFLDVSFGKQLRDRKKYVDDVIEVNRLEDVPGTHTPCYTGKNVDRYSMKWSGLACLLDRRAKRGGCWDDEKHNANPKLVTRQIGITPVFGLDSRGFHCLNTVFMLTSRGPLSLSYLLGLLNSRLLAEFWKNRFYDQRGRFPKIKGAYLKQMPIRPIDFTDEQDRGRYDRLISMVDQMLVAKQQEAAASGHAKEIATRKCAALDRQIDTLVYELYGLTEAEIALVEGTA